MEACHNCGEKISFENQRYCSHCGILFSSRAPNAQHSTQVERFNKGHGFLATVFPMIPKTYWHPRDKDINWVNGELTEASWRVKKGKSGEITHGPGIALDIGVYCVEFELSLLDDLETHDQEIITAQVTSRNGAEILESTLVKSNALPDYSNPEFGTLRVPLYVILHRFVENVEFKIISWGTTTLEVHGIKLIPQIGSIWLPDGLPHYPPDEWGLRTDGSVVAHNIEDSLLFGPFVHLSPQSYQVAFKLELPEGVTSGEIAVVDVISQETENEHNIIVSEKTISRRIYDELTLEYGKEGVFFDVASINPGEDWENAILNALEQALVQLVIIGPRWLEPRLSDENDYVRQEIERGFRRKIPVIPVTINETEVPTEQQLPPSWNLRRLPFIQGIQIRKDDHFDSDMERLLAVIDGILKSKP